MLLADAEWFSVDYGQVGYHLKDMYENYKNYVDKGKRQGYYSRTNFSFDKMREKLDEVLTAKLPEFPKQSPLVLPKLKKINLPKLQTK